MHRLTMPKMATSYQPLQSLEAKKLLYDLVRDPSGYERHFERYAAGLIFRLVYGQTVETGDEPYVRQVVEVNHTLERVASPGAYLVDSVPALMMLPEALAPFKQEGKRLHEKEITLFRSLLNDVRERMDKGNCPDCFAKVFWEEVGEIGLTVDQGAYALGTLFEAGTGTTSALMMSFCLCMCLHPEWQERGAQEIQKICGERMPEFSDIPDLPTTRAIIKEVSRWRPVTAGG
jgi:cytochrome P450